MDLVRSWSTGLVTYLMLGPFVGLAAGFGSVWVTVWVTSHLGIDGGMDGTVGWVGHALAVSFLVAVVAALAHSAPQRYQPVRNAVAVLAVPVASIAYTVGNFVWVNWPDLSRVSDWLQLLGFGAATLAGAVAGWALMRRIPMMRPSTAGTTAEAE